MLRVTLFVFVSLFAVTLSCRNPFLPPTGKPILSHMRREKPIGVIDQLIDSYELKRLDLFEDLLADSFRFYVAQTFESTFKAKYTPDQCEKPDTNMLYVDGAVSYYYWTRPTELQSHRRLFTNDERATKTIQFQPPPEITSTRYLTNEKGDTTNAELRISGGELLITVTTSTLITNYTVSIEKQVFYLEKDPDNLWVIRKWYDLSSAPSSL